ncbi:hypothetical protein WJX73_007913 [Symbiochloris irregularis]|uniref:Protein kinase domain-containing protein n=1 Tax=Symbiochloris irregularis TaxID=706552 RepID=A0AAW1PD81_9CHLO
MPAGGGRPVVEGIQVSIPLPATGPFPSPVSHLFSVQTKRAWAPYGQNSTHKEDKQEKCRTSPAPGSSCSSLISSSLALLSRRAPPPGAPIGAGTMRAQAPYGWPGPEQNYSSSGFGRGPARMVAIAEEVLDDSSTVTAVAAPSPTTHHLVAQAAGPLAQSNQQGPHSDPASSHSMLQEPPGGWCKQHFMYSEADLLGEGTYAEVFSATETLSGCTVALKVIDLSTLQPPERHTLAREIPIHATLDHPNILKLHGSFCEQDKLYMILEKTELGDLCQYLYKSAHKGPQTEQFAARVIVGLARALDYCLEQFILHRDLKADNLLLMDADGSVKLADFGCAVVSPSHRRRSYCGTELYMAPEVLAIGSAHGPKVLALLQTTSTEYDETGDWWSMGILMYELLVGQTPFDEEDEQDGTKVLNTMEGFLAGTPLFYPAFVTTGARDLISQLLVKDSSRRISPAAGERHP